MMAVIQLYFEDELEYTYLTLFMVGMLATMFLAKWTTKNLLIFIFLIATMLMVSKAVRDIYYKHQFNNQNSYQVIVPV